jgi:hypothetical protein
LIAQGGFRTGDVDDVMTAQDTSCNTRKMHRFETKRTGQLLPGLPDTIMVVAVLAAPATVAIGAMIRIAEVSNATHAAVMTVKDVNFRPELADRTMNAPKADATGDALIADRLAGVALVTGKRRCLCGAHATPSCQVAPVTGIVDSAAVEIQLRTTLLVVVLTGETHIVCRG